MIRRVREVSVFRNKFVEVYNDDVNFADGSEGQYVRIGHPDSGGQAIVVLPHHDARIGMVRTFRYPIGDWEWALPRGFGHGDDALVSAQAELMEELGVEATSWKLLGEVTPDSGLLASRVAIFYAKVMNNILAPLDTREVAEARWFTPMEVKKMIAEGELRDGFSLSALMIATTVGLLDLGSD